MGNERTEERTDAAVVTPVEAFAHLKAKWSRFKDQIPEHLFGPLVGPYETLADDPTNVQAFEDFRNEWGKVRNKIPDNIRGELEPMIDGYKLALDNAEESGVSS